MKTKIILFTVAVLASVPFSVRAASESPTCDFNDIKNRSCQFLKDHSSEKNIVLSDGRSFANPEAPKDAAPDKNSVAPKGMSQEQYLKYADETLELQMSLNHIFESGTFKNYPRRSLEALKTQNAQVALAGAIYTSRFAPSGTKVFHPEFKGLALPKPFNDPKAPMAFYSPDELLALGNQLSEKEKNEISQVVLEYAKKQQGTNAAQNLVYNSASPLPAAPATNVAARKDEMQKLFLEAKEEMIEVIKNGAQGKLSPEQLNQIEKINRIEIHHGDEPEVKDASDCGNNEINAFYNPLNHTMNMCPSMYNLPKSMLMHVLGHEMGHSIDPCSGPNVLYKVNREKFLTYAQVATARGPDSSDFKALKTLISSSPGAFINIDLNYYLPKDAVQRLRESGALEEVVPGVPLDKSPVLSVRQCLIQKEGFQEVTDKDIAQKLKDTAEAAKRSGGNWNQQMESQFRQALEEGRECNGTISKRSEMGETIADVYGAAVASRYLKRNPPADDRDRVGALAFFSAEFCVQPAYGNRRAEMTSHELVDAMDKITNSILKKEHPRQFKRLEKIMMKMPGVASTFGCAEKDHGCLDALKPAILAAPAASTKPSQVQAPAQGNEATK